MGAQRGDPERDATEILIMCWLRDETDEIRLPVDPFFIARRLGLRVYLSQLEPGVSGMMRMQPGPNEGRSRPPSVPRYPEIHLDETDSRDRQRFACAHQLGHYLKRAAAGNADEPWEYVDRREDLASQGSDPEEIYANEFAAHLLMPRDLVQRRKGERSVATLAYEFGVPSDAMNLRLDSLNRVR